jgi:hypothetical protein
MSSRFASITKVRDLDDVVRRPQSARRRPEWVPLRGEAVRHDVRMSTFDWDVFERELHDVLIAAISRTISGNSDENFYAAALYAIYSEREGVIGLPDLNMNGEQSDDDTDEELGRWSSRWDVGDWDYFVANWLPEDRATYWSDALTEAASGRGEAHWDAVFDRYLRMMVAVCRRARATLRSSRVIEDDLLVLVLDHEGEMDHLVKQTLSSEELQRHFPDL